MGGPGLEFKCQGRCRMDWRAVWNSVQSERTSIPIEI